MCQKIEKITFSTYIQSVGLFGTQRRNDKIIMIKLL